MEDFDYYSVMEKRIKYFSGKYDPFNKLPLEGEFKREKQNYSQINEPTQKKIFTRQLVEVCKSVISFLF